MYSYYNRGGGTGGGTEEGSYNFHPPGPGRSQQQQQQLRGGKGSHRNIQISNHINNNSPTSPLLVRDSHSHSLCHSSKHVRIKKKNMQQPQPQSKMQPNNHHPNSNLHPDHHDHHHHHHDSAVMEEKEEADKFERFEMWLRENDAQFEMLELRREDDDHTTMDTTANNTSPTINSSTTNGSAAAAALGAASASGDQISTGRSLHSVLHHHFGKNLTPQHSHPNPNTKQNHSSVPVSPPFAMDEEKKEVRIISAARARNRNRLTTKEKDEPDDGENEDQAGETNSNNNNINDKNNNNNNNNHNNISEMRGVYAKQCIPPHTVCMSIPRACLITVEMGQATPLGQMILQHAHQLDLDAPKHIFLMIYLLWDRKVNGGHSFFAPYYAILPRTLSNMPIFWNARELKALTGSYLLEQIADRKAAIADDYHSICAVAPELADLCTLDEFMWARMCVCSRNFGLLIDGVRTSALVPQADMLNHYRPRETKWTFDEDRQAFTITTLQQAIPVGAQVYDSYGQKCNHRFLLNYGFAIENNRELDGFCPNEVPMELCMQLDDLDVYDDDSNNKDNEEENALFFKEKLNYWLWCTSLHSGGGPTTTSTTTSGDHNVEVEVQKEEEEEEDEHGGEEQDPRRRVKRVRVCVSNNDNTKLLFSLLRVLVLNREELYALLSSANNSATASNGSNSYSNSNSSTRGRDPSSSEYYWHPHFPPPPRPSPLHHHHHPISIRNERAAMQRLLRMVQTQLRRYPTSLAQDHGAVRDLVRHPRFSNARHAKIHVMGEKSVLQHFGLWARTSVYVLSQMQDEMASLWRFNNINMNKKKKNGGYDEDNDSDNCCYAAVVEENSSIEVQLRNTAAQYGHDDDDDYDSNADDDGDEEEEEDKNEEEEVDYNHRVVGGDINNDRFFDALIRQMEEYDYDRDYDYNYDNNYHNLVDPNDFDYNNCNYPPPPATTTTTLHPTIVQYCTDVLGALRREELYHYHHYQRCYHRMHKKKKNKNKAMEEKRNKQMNML